VELVPMLEGSMESCFVWVCMAEVSTEIGWIVFLVWKLWVGGAWSHWGKACPFLTVIANIPRLWLAAVLLRKVVRAQEERRNSVRSCTLHVWLSSLAAMTAWYCLAMVWANGPWVPRTLATLSIVNALLLLFSVLLLYNGLYVEELEGAQAGVKIFRRPRRAAAESSLQFEPVCVICLLELEEGQLVGQLPCGHAFHEPCIRRWLAVKGCCPMRCPLHVADVESGAADEVAAAAPRAAPLHEGGGELEVVPRTDGEVVGPVPEAAEDWAEEPVVAGLNGGAFDAVLSAPARPPEPELSVVYV